MKINGKPAIRNNGNADFDGISVDKRNWQQFCNKWFDNREYVIANNADPQELSGSDEKYRYYNEITFKLSGGRARDDSWNQVRFQLKVAGDNQAIIGHQGNAESQEYGLVENYNEPYSIATAIRFGRECTADPVSTTGRIKIYDPDKGLFGPQYVSVWRLKRAKLGEPGGDAFSNWKRLDKDDFTENTNTNKKKWDSGSWKVIGGDGVDVPITIKEYRSDFVYIMIIDNPNQGKYLLNPTGNVLSYQLPGDPINGQMLCDSAELIPKASVDSSEVEPGGSVTGLGKVVKNAGPDFGTHEWTITRVTYDPGKAEYTGSIGEDTEANVCNSGVISGSDYDQCEQIPGSPYTDSFGAGDVDPSPQNPINDAIADDVPIGTVYCYITSVNNPRNNDGSLYAHSNPACATVGYRPKLQVWGYDAKVGGKISTSLSQIDKTYGSWAEYGVLSDGSNSNLASGKGLFGGESGNAQSQWSPLTFANFLADGTFGQYGAVKNNVPGMISQVGVPNVSGGGNVVNWTAIKGDVNCARTGQHICNINKTLLINQNIDYGDETKLNAIDDLPRLIIVADNIIIDKSVSKIDAWLITRNYVAGAPTIGGFITTCGEVRNSPASQPNSYLVLPDAANLTEGTCSTPLEFNGPVITDTMLLYRTGGKTKNSMSEAAERFNLRADAFLSGKLSNAATGSIVTTDSVTELPPRF